MSRNNLSADSPIVNYWVFPGAGRGGCTRGSPCLRRKDTDSIVKKSSAHEDPLYFKS